MGYESTGRCRSEPINTFNIGFLMGAGRLALDRFDADIVESAVI